MRGVAPTSKSRRAGWPEPLTGRHTLMSERPPLPLKDPRESHPDPSHLLEVAYDFFQVIARRCCHMSQVSEVGHHYQGLTARPNLDLFH